MLWLNEFFHHHRMDDQHISHDMEGTLTAVILPHLYNQFHVSFSFCQPPLHTVLLLDPVDTHILVSRMVESGHFIFDGIQESDRAPLVDQTVKCLPAMWESWVRSLGQEDPLEKEMATHSSTLACKIPWME